MIMTVHVQINDYNQSRTRKVTGRVGTRPPTAAPWQEKSSWGLGYTIFEGSLCYTQLGLGRTHGEWLR
jgi:hypothetical protein